MDDIVIIRSTGKSKIAVVFCCLVFVGVLLLTRPAPPFDLVETVFGIGWFFFGIAIFDLATKQVHIGRRRLRVRRVGMWSEYDLGPTPSAIVNSDGALEIRNSDGKRVTTVTTEFTEFFERAQAVLGVGERQGGQSYR